MVEIVKSSEYNARVIQLPNFKNKIKGYGFTYPVMNTIDICNLFIEGGETDIKIERMGMQKWSYDENTNILIIKRNDDEDEYKISNVEELNDAMLKYFEEHKQEILEKTLETNLNKSKSKLGNQNAKKKDIVTNIEESSHNNIKPVSKPVNNSVTDIYDADYPPNKEGDNDLIEKVLQNNNQEFCSLNTYVNVRHKTMGEYYYWCFANCWLNMIAPDTQEKLQNAGYNYKKALEVERMVLASPKIGSDDDDDIPF